MGKVGLSLVRKSVSCSSYCASWDTAISMACTKLLSAAISRYLEYQLDMSAAFYQHIARGTVMVAVILAGSYGSGSPSTAYSSTLSAGLSAESWLCWTARPWHRLSRSDGRGCCAVPSSCSQTEFQQGRARVRAAGC